MTTSAKANARDTHCDIDSFQQYRPKTSRSVSAVKNDW